MFKVKYFVLSAMTMLMTVATAMAQGATETHTTGGGVRIPIAIGVGIAAFGGALGDGRAIAGACEGTARNPSAGGRIFTMLLLGLALIETLVLFTFLTLFIPEPK